MCECANAEVSVRSKSHEQNPLIIKSDYQNRAEQRSMAEVKDETKKVPHGKARCRRVNQKTMHSQRKVMAQNSKYRASTALHNSCGKVMQVATML